MPRHGENIFKRKDGRWEARYIHHYESGKAKYRYLYAKTYTEVKAKRNEELTKRKSIHAHTIQANIPFTDIAAEWLYKIKPQVKESTYTRYERNTRVYLLPILGQQQTSELDLDFLKCIPQTLLNTGGKSGGALSPKTVSDILCVLKSILRYSNKKGCSEIDVTEISCSKWKVE